MRKRLFTFCALAAMLFGLMLTANGAEVVESGYCGGEGDGTNLSWTLTDDGTLTISGSGAMANYLEEKGQDETPIIWSLRTLSAEEIISTEEASPWSNSETPLKTLVLEEGITAIGNNAFYRCSGLTGELVIPDSVTSIGEWAFMCTGFSGDLLIPDSVTKIEIGAFQGCENVDGVYFCGNAPEIAGGWYSYSSFDTDQTLYYVPGMTGWTDSDDYSAETGEWECYALSQWEGPEICEHTAQTTVYTPNVEKTHDVTITCDACGEVLHSAVGESCTYVNGTCQLCGGLGELVAGTNMTLGNELEMDFRVKTQEVADAGLTAYVSHYTVDSQSGELAEVSCSAYTQEEWLVQGEYYKIPMQVAACQMTDVMHIEIKDAEGNACGMEYTDSVYQYLTRLYEATTEDTIRSLVVDMLNYGASAQEYFGYREDFPANIDLTQEQQAYATVAVETVNQQQKEDARYYGTSLSLKDRIEVNFIFNNLTGYNIGTMYAEVSFTNSLGEEKTATLSGEALTSLAFGSRCQVKVTQTVLADASELVTVTLHDADGNVVSAVKDSVESYVSRYVAKYGDKTGLYGNIMKLSRSALNYALSKQ